MANGGLLKELQELQPAPGATTTLPPRDVRARRPFLLRAIIRLRTLRSFARVAVLGVLDAAGVFVAIWTALELKAVLRGKSDLVLSYHQAQDVAPLAILVTLLLFARSDLYSDRAVRPGFTRVIASLFQATVVVMLFAIVQGENFSSYYIFFVSLLPRPDNGLKNLGPLEEIERHFEVVDEVLITDPDFPQERALALIDTCHRHGIRVRVAPSTMEILMDRVEFVPGQTLPLFELKPPVFDGIDFVLKRTFDVIGSLLLLLVLSPFLLVVALLVKLTSRGP